jgi:hypothetical protein
MGMLLGLARRMTEGRRLRLIKRVWWKSSTACWAMERADPEREREAKEMM